MKEKELSFIDNINIEAKGLFRNMDKHGRIVLPVEYRQAYGLLDSGAVIEIIGTDAGILIRNARQGLK